MGTTSGDFVNSIRNILNRKRTDENRKRAILREIFESISDSLKKSGKVEIRSVKDFETNEISYILNLYMESDNIYDDFGGIVGNSDSIVRGHKIDQKNSVYAINFGKSLISNSSSDTDCFIELKITGKYYFTVKISLKSENISYQIYESNYFYLKMWIFDGSDFSNHEIQIRTPDRNKKRMRVDLNDHYVLNIIFDEMGEITETNISKKRGAKLNF